MDALNGQLTLADVLNRQRPKDSKPVQSTRLTGKKWCAGELLDLLRLLPGNPRIKIEDLDSFDNLPENSITIPKIGSTAQDIISMLERFDEGTVVRVRDFTRVSPKGCEIFGLWYKQPIFERYYPDDPDVRRVRLVRGRPPEGQNLVVCFVDRRYSGD